jgi:serpin B
MLYDLTKQENKEYEKQYGITYHDPLKIANAVFVDYNVTLKKEFAQNFLDYYRGNAINVDFSSSAAVKAVNDWASENTEGLIPEIIQEFDPSTVAAIANAIYFSDRWEWEFDPEKTVKDVFYSPEGEREAHYMLREGDSQVYYEDERIQAMPLSFKTGGGLYIILPKDESAKDLLVSMTGEYFDTIQKNYDVCTGKLLLPRFSVESDAMQLNNTLTAMGVPLFDEETAPLTGGLIEENIPVWLSSAVHKAVVDVDEKGTTAAAVTVMAAGAGGVMPEPTEPFVMNCDKPFVFILYSHTYDGGSQVLFTGIVNKP